APTTVGAALHRHLWIAVDPRRRRLLPVLRRRAVDAGAARRASDRTGLGIGADVVHAGPHLAGCRLAVRRLDRRPGDTAARVPDAGAHAGGDGPYGGGGPRGQRGGDLGAARARVDAARSDVPRPRRCGTARTVRLSRVRRVELSEVA